MIGSTILNADTHSRWTAWLLQNSLQASSGSPKGKAEHQDHNSLTTSEKVRLFEATAELAKLRAGLHTKEQEKAVMQLQLQQQQFAVKKMSSDVSRQKSDLCKESELTLAAKDQQIEQLESRLQQNESAVQQLYAVLQLQQEAVRQNQPEQKQNKFELLDPEVLAKIKMPSSSGSKSRDGPNGRSNVGPKTSVAAAAAASFVTHLNKAAR